MTIYASKTPRDLNHDPMPWAHTACGYSWCDDFGGRFQTNNGTGNEFSPRPEFDHAQHNEPNPVLTAFRQIDAGRGEYADWVRDFDERPEFWTRGHNGTPSRFPQYTPAQVAHARRVLERLASLAG